MQFKVTAAEFTTAPTGIVDTAKVLDKVPFATFALPVVADVVKLTGPAAPIPAVNRFVAPPVHTFKEEGARIGVAGVAK